MRKDLTKSELMLWSQLKNRNLLGHKFHRQYGIGSYIADFYCAAVKLVIELDGDSHYAEGASEYDSARKQFMNGLGIKTIRILNYEILDNLDGVVEMLGRIVEDRENEILGAKAKRGRRRKRNNE